MTSTMQLVAIYCISLLQFSALFHSSVAASLNAGPVSDAPTTSLPISESVAAQLGDAVKTGSGVVTDLSVAVPLEVSSLTFNGLAGAGKLVGDLANQYGTGLDISGLNAAQKAGISALNTAGEAGVSGSTAAGDAGLAGLSAGGEAGAGLNAAREGASILNGGTDLGVGNLGAFELAGINDETAGGLYSGGFTGGLETAINAADQITGQANLLAKPLVEGGGRYLDNGLAMFGFRQPLIQTLATTGWNAGENGRQGAFQFGRIVPGLLSQSRNQGRLIPFLRF